MVPTAYRRFRRRPQLMVHLVRVLGARAEGVDAIIEEQVLRGAVPGLRHLYRRHAELVHGVREEADLARAVDAIVAELRAIAKEAGVHFVSTVICLFLVGELKRNTTTYNAVEWTTVTDTPCSAHREGCMWYSNTLWANVQASPRGHWTARFMSGHAMPVYAIALGSRRFAFSAG